MPGDSEGSMRRLRTLIILVEVLEVAAVRCTCRDGSAVEEIGFPPVLWLPLGNFKERDTLAARRIAKGCKVGDDLIK